MTINSMSKPFVKTLPGGYRFNWLEGAEEMLQIDFTRLSEDTRRGAITSEISVTLDCMAKPPILSGHRFNLLSTQGRNGLIKKLLTKNDYLPWDDIIEDTCAETIKLFRMGEPPIKISDIAISTTPKYRLYPILLENEANLIYGDGGGGKSTTASMMAVTIQDNYSILGWIPESGNVLYLDYETSADTMKERIDAMRKALNITPGEQDILYRFCFRSLTDSVDELQKIVSENDIALVIIDSVGMACGGDTEKADVVIAYFRALRSLRVTTLSIDHVSKTSDGKTPFGSIYKRNLSRAMFELKHTPGNNNILNLALYHRKANTTSLIKPIGYRVEFVKNGERTEEIKFEGISVASIPELAAGLSTRTRIVNILSGGSNTVKELAERIDTTEGQIRARLNEGKDTTFAKLEDGFWGLMTYEQ